MLSWGRADEALDAPRRRQRPLFPGEPHDLPSRPFRPLPRPMSRALVTGGAGYIGALAVEELRNSGREVRVLDSLLHGQEDVAARVEGLGAELIRGDIRDADARAAALDG